MNTKLKAELEQAIENTIQAGADGLIHDELARKMTDAAEAVFDAAMSAQKYSTANT